MCSTRPGPRDIARLVRSSSVGATHLILEVGIERVHVRGSVRSSDDAPR